MLVHFLGLMQCYPLMGVSGRVMEVMGWQPDGDTVCVLFGFPFGHFKI